MGKTLGDDGDGDAEQYQGHELSGGQTALDTRRARYRHLWRDPDGPLRTDLIPYDDLFVEPFYQLLRLQLLAWRLEATHELDAEVVRLVYVAPGANIELASSFNRPTHASLGESRRQPVASTVWDTWASMQRRPDRFVWMDSADLVGDASPCSDELKARYGHLGAAGTARSQVAAEDHVGRLRSACSDAISILGRVSADHGVLAQVMALHDHELRRFPSSLIRETTMRLEEIAELARRVRAEEIGEILHRGEQPR